jgi:hypothetical protein
MSVPQMPHNLMSTDRQPGGGSSCSNVRNSTVSLPVMIPATTSAMLRHHRIRIRGAIADHAHRDEP